MESCADVEPAICETVKTCSSQVESLLACSLQTIVNTGTIPGFDNQDDASSWEWSLKNMYHLLGA